MTGTLLWYRFVLHACNLQHVGPLSTRAGVRVLEVLSEMVRSKEFLCLVALAEFVDKVQMLGSDIPLRWVGKLFATVTAYIGAIS